MRKVLSFSGFLMLGLVVSQFLPMIAGEGYGAVKVHIECTTLCMS